MIILSAIYLLCILLCSYLSVEAGSELLTQYEMAATNTPREALGEDLGLGLLLLMGLVPELIVGVIIGCWAAQKICNKYVA